MSSILKALKKLEQEKVRRGDLAVDLALDIHRGARRQRYHRLLPVSLVILVLGCVAAAVWLLHSPATEWIAAGARPPAPVSPLLPRAPLPPHPVTVNDPETVAAIPQAPSQSLAGAASSVTQTARLRSDRPQPSVRSSGRRPSSQSRPAPGAAALAPPVAVGTDRPGLQLSGIVWQQDPATRMAIIDDLPVMVGTEISGAKVLEILPDRVVLTANGKKRVLVLRP
jgi:general secretion pathway protein B